MTTDQRLFVPVKHARRTHFPALAVACASLAGGPEALAQQPPRTSDPAAAEALYKAGRELLEQGNWPLACQKFEASMALNAAVSALLNLARCHERDGKLTQALLDYKRALQLNLDTLGDERRAALDGVARAGLAALEPRVPRLRITAASAPPGLSITRDGLPILPGALGEDVPVDPGKHEIVASAPGHAAQRRTVVLEEGRVETVSVELGREAPAAPLPPKAAVVAPASQGVPAWAWVSGGVGLALAGASVAFRLDQGSAESALVDRCGDALVCDPAAGYDPASDNARKNRDFGLFVGFGIAGAGALGAAVYGILSGSKPAAAELSMVPLMGPDTAGLGVRGAL